MAQVEETGPEEDAGPLPSVSVVVPNFNYAAHIVRRLETVFGQTLALHEVIVLDDASTDDSIAVLSAYREASGRSFTIVHNEANSGSVFRQWYKAATLATGDLLWIAEADDLAHPEFLARVVRYFRDPEMKLAYSQSRQIDEHGTLLRGDYLDYVSDIDPNRWTRSWVNDARAELAEGMLIKNAVPNVSAVVFRREALADVMGQHLDEIVRLRHAGDWLVYALLLAGGGRIGFEADALNDHRRHSGSVTLSGFGMNLLREIAAMQVRVAELLSGWGALKPEPRAGAYLQELYVQFGLAKPGQEHWSQDPALATFARFPLHADPSPVQHADLPADTAQAEDARRGVKLGMRRFWQRLPLDPELRWNIERRLYGVAPGIFSGMPGFERWKASQAAQALMEVRPHSMPTAAPQPDQECVPRFVGLHQGSDLEDPAVRLVAFYLPQFHPIPENDRWWGQGFTEWVNVLRGSPQFDGHHQPLHPGDLGYYDLRSTEIQRRQVALAKRYGLGGFCFYFYWFAGTRLLEGPTLAYLQDQSLDLPFCLCWANENWSRRWDGKANELLMSQSHSAEDDIAFIEYVSRYLRDPRYIRVGGKPLLIVYRPDLLPDPSATAARWRDWCHDQGIGEIHLATTESFVKGDPGEYGFDAAIEFPPNNTAPPEIASKVPGLSAGFAGHIYDWRVFPERSRAYTDPGYRVYRGVNPCWDNTARRLEQGAIFFGANPDGFREWLTNAARETLNRLPVPSERLVFVNAWNEWAEGAVLEPTRDWGYAYLAATREALESLRQPTIAVVTHDAHRFGAQYLALHIAQSLRDDLDYRVHSVALGEGALLNDFAACGDLHVLAHSAQDGPAAVALARWLRLQGVETAIVNTTASGGFCGALATAGIRCISLVHELPDLIARHGLRNHAKTLTTHANAIVFPSDFVRQRFATVTPIDDARTFVRPQGLYKRNRFAAPDARQGARAELRERLRLAPTARVQLGVGYGDHRKGIDLFVRAGIHLIEQDQDYNLVWVGGLDPKLERECLSLLQEKGMLSHCFFVGHQDDTDLFYAGADVYALTSREDPFPSVMLESLEVGVPIVAFADTGGCVDLARHGVVVLVPRLDTEAFTDAVVGLLGDETRLKTLDRQARKLVNERFLFVDYVTDLLTYAANAISPPKS